MSDNPTQTGLNNLNSPLFFNIYAKFQANWLVRRQIIWLDVHVNVILLTHNFIDKFDETLFGQKYFR